MLKLQLQDIHSQRLVSLAYDCGDHIPFVYILVLILMFFRFVKRVSRMIGSIRCLAACIGMNDNVKSHLW
jgi:hypothetical protein